VRGRDVGSVRTERDVDAAGEGFEEAPPVHCLSYSIFFHQDTYVEIHSRLFLFVH